MLYPTGLWVDLGKLVINATQQISPGIHHRYGSAGRALIYRENNPHQSIPLKQAIHQAAS
jgi:hypothetical protein